MFAAAKNVDNLIATIDYNGKQIDGSLNDVVSLGNLEAKWISFGWTVLKMDGNDIENILKVMSEAKSECFKGKLL